VIEALTLHCPKCGHRYESTPDRWQCSCGGALSAPLTAGLRRDTVDRSEPSLWRYAAGLPAIARPPAAYFGEGRTPLVDRPWAGRTIGFKLDFLMPTGSFKDRGAALVVNALAGAGVGAIAEDSSGNAAASYAAYGAAAGIRCRVFVPDSASPAKIAQARAYGADIVAVPGDRAATAAAAMADRHGLYAGHNWHPLFIEGVKTIAFELWEQHEWAVPDVVIAPIGAGSGILGLDRGFRQLALSGAVSRAPRLYAAETQCWATISRASASPDAAESWLNGERQPSVAEGLMIAEPPRLLQVIRALKRSGGRPVAVSEPAILHALHALAEQGLLVEPSSAVAAAAASALVDTGEIVSGDRVVVVLTGSGLKTSSAMHRPAHASLTP
jgi:threonine synthase